MSDDTRAIEDWRTARKLADMFAAYFNELDDEEFCNNAARQLHRLRLHGVAVG